MFLLAGRLHFIDHSIEKLFMMLNDKLIALHYCRTHVEYSKFGQMVTNLSV